MKKINVRFEQDDSLDGIDIIIRSDKCDAQVNSVIEMISHREPLKLTAMDKSNCLSIIEEKDIVFISADGKNIRIITVDGIFRAKQSLQNVEEILNKNFLRVSRFEIINLRMVRKYDFTLAGTLRIEFINGMETWASRRCIPIIKNKLSGKEGFLC